MSAATPDWSDRCPTFREFMAPRVSAEVPPEPKGTGLPARKGVDLQMFKGWAPEAQEKALEIIRQRDLNPWKPFFCPRTDCDGQPHGDWDWQHGRADQRPPPMSQDWLTWLLMGGRGGGKTRAGSEAIHRIAKKVPRIHLIAPTGPDLRDTMVEGVSGLLATAPPDFMPQWEPSKKRLTWPNGSIALGFSGEEPDRLRGPQCYFCWIDEPALMPLIDGENGVWNNLLFGLRLGTHARIVATTTPKPTKWMKALYKDPTTITSNFSTYANLANLDPQFRRNVLARFENTRLGKQELDGKILADVVGALWKMGWIEYVDLVPDSFERVVVAIDPAGTRNHRSDETGIVVLGILGTDIYVLADATDKYSPAGWASEAVRLYHLYSADAIVAEKNYGGDMVREVLEKNGAKRIKIEEVTSRRGKALRAEPIAALYERPNTHVYHVRGLDTLEDEMTTWIQGEGDSPNRIDALVHGATALAKIVMPASIATPVSYGKDQGGTGVPTSDRTAGILDRFRRSGPSGQWGMPQTG